MRAPWVAACLGLSGCVPATINVNGHLLAQDDWASASHNVLSVATFEMHCAAAQLQLTVLNATQIDWGGGRYVELAQQVGAAGCGQQRVYTRFHSKWMSSAPSATP